MDINFLIANETHIPKVVSLCNEVFEEETDVNTALEIFEKNKIDQNQIYLIGMIGNDVIAHTKITIVPTIFKDMNTYAILNHVCVKKEYRKHKLATYMLRVVERVCKERGCTSMKLWSNNTRVAAHACYKRFGFVINDAGFFSKEI